MDSFDQSFDRTRNLLEYGSPQDAMTALVASGVPVDEAFLLIKAAQVVPAPPPFKCPFCRGKDGKHKMSCSFVK